MLLLPAFLLALPLQATAPVDPPREIRVSLETTRLRELHDADIDVIAIDRAATSARAIAYDADLAVLDELGVRYEVAIEDLTAWYAERAANDAGAAPEGATLGQWLTPPFGQGSMGGYYTFSEAVSVVSQIQAAYPSLFTTSVSIGTSIEGRPLWAFSMSDNPGVDEGEPEVRIDSLHHAREPMGMHALLWYVLWLADGYGTDPVATYLVDERVHWFVPVVNPDGYVYNESIAPGGGGLWRKNRRDNGGTSFGVDLNRNYDYEWGYDDIGSSPSTNNELYRGTAPASEPETTAMQAFIGAHPFQSTLSIHCFGDLWLRPWGYDNVSPSNLAQYLEVANLAIEVNQYANVSGYELYPANGVTVDYDHGVGGSLSWSPEIGGDEDGFWPAPSRIVPLALENRLALTRTALAAGAYLRISELEVVDTGDGDGFFESGETVDVVVTARNSGVAASGTSVVAHLSTTSADASVSSSPSFDYGTIGSFAEATNAGAPFTLSLDAGVAPGTVIPLLVQLDVEGATFPTQLAFVAGERFTYLADDLELDHGWTVGDPADTASTGIWERGVPIETTSGANVSNPGEDATPGAGTQCFVTGNAGGSAGLDDVDGGATTLYSPPFDLSGAAAAYVSYSRWWSNLTFADDALVVEISSDGGNNWAPVETVTTSASAWESVELRVDQLTTPTADMQLRFIASDTGNGSLVEAGVDDVVVSVYADVPRFNLYGTSQIDTSLVLNVTGQPGDFYVDMFSTGQASFPIAGVSGDFLLDPAHVWGPLKGFVPAARHAPRVVNLPDDPDLIGATLYWQAIVVNASSDAWLTNDDVMTIF